MLSTHDARRCLYCFEAVTRLDSMHSCDGCGEQLHAECFELNHGCTSCGCIRCEASPSAASGRSEVAWTREDHTGLPVGRGEGDHDLVVPKTAEPLIAVATAVPSPTSVAPHDHLPRPSIDPQSSVAAGMVATPAPVPTNPVWSSDPVTAAPPRVRRFRDQCGGRVGAADIDEQISNETPIITPVRQPVRTGTRTYPVSDLQV